MSTSALAAGSHAPDFTLPGGPDQQVRLSDFQGRPVILAFYPADWSPVCDEQMSLYNEMLGEFAEHGAQLLGISVDGPWSHAAFAAQRRLHFPLLSDCEPKGDVARRYGVYRAEEGVSERAVFVIDGKGVVRWSYVSPPDVNPGGEGILKTLEEMDDKKEER
jgi:peroxiredoxin